MDKNTRNEKIQSMLESFASAFTQGDGEGAASCWEVPAVVISDEGTRAVGTLSEVAEFFGGASEQYTTQGVEGTRPDVQGITWLTDRLASVEVRWPYIDGEGAEKKTSESSTYIVRFNEADQPKISSVVMMGIQKTDQH